MLFQVWNNWQGNQTNLLKRMMIYPYLYLIVNGLHNTYIIIWIELVEWYTIYILKENDDWYEYTSQSWKEMVGWFMNPFLILKKNTGVDL